MYPKLGPIRTPPNKKTGGKNKGGGMWGGRTSTKIKRWSLHIWRLQQFSLPVFICGIVQFQIFYDFSTLVPLSPGPLYSPGPLVPLSCPLVPYIRGPGSWPIGPIGSRRITPIPGSLPIGPIGPGPLGPGPGPWGLVHGARVPAHWARAYLDPKIKPAVG